MSITNPSITTSSTNVSFFGGKKKKSNGRARIADKNSKQHNTAKLESHEFMFNLQNIDVARIDKDFNMDEMKNIGEPIGLIFNLDDHGTSLEKLGISSLKNEPIITYFPNDKTKLQMYITMKDVTSKQCLPRKTDIPCFGCHRVFSHIPLGVPIEYYPSIYTSKNNITKIKKITTNERKKLENDKSNDITILEYFDTDGVACSFNCIVRLIEDYPSPLYKKSASLIPKMYKKILGNYPKGKIIKSPSWRLLERYGGCISDEEFETNLQTIKFTDTNQISKTLKIMNPVGRIFNIEDV
jgi:hypothetical protein